MGRPKGSRNKQGGMYTAATGYVFVMEPGHPNADKRGYVREHILVMSRVLGRAIADDEVVHHINGIRNDNSESNLQVMKRGDHHSHHHKGLIKPNSLANLRRTTSEGMRKIWATTLAHKRDKPKTCDYCGKEYFRRVTKQPRPHHAHQYCSRACYGAHYRSGAVQKREASPYEMNPNSLANLTGRPQKKPLKVCDYCKKEFYRRGVPRHEHTCCSRQCAINLRFNK